LDLGRVFFPFSIHFYNINFKFTLTILCYKKSNKFLHIKGERIIKITKKIMMAALITSFLSGSVYAAYDPHNQSATKVMNLKDIGFASTTKLLTLQLRINDNFFTMS